METIPGGVTSMIRSYGNKMSHTPIPGFNDRIPNIFRAFFYLLQEKLPNATLVTSS